MPTTGRHAFAGAHKTERGSETEDVAVIKMSRAALRAAQ